MRVPMDVLNYNRQQRCKLQVLGFTYGCLSDGSLAEFVEVEEEFSDTDSILGDESLNASLNVALASEFTWGLVIALMTMLRSPHKLDLVADC